MTRNSLKICSLVLHCFLISLGYTVVVAQSNNDKTKITNRLKQFEAALNNISTKSVSIDQVTADFFSSPGIEIEDDVTSYPPSSSSQSPQPTYPKRYLQKLQQFKCSVKFNLSNITDFCKTEQGWLRAIATVRREMNGPRFPQTITITRYIEMVCINNVWKVNAMTYSKNSRIISKCTSSDTPNPTYAELQATQSQLNKVKKERDKVKAQVANLKKDKAQLNNALAEAQKESGNCADENSKLNSSIADLNRKSAELTLRVNEFEKEKLARLEAENVEAQRKFNARLDLSEARKLYNTLLQKEATLRGQPQDEGVWEAFRLEEQETIRQIYETLKEHLQYMESKDNLMLVDILGNNKGDIIGYLSPDKKDATNIANRMILKGLGDISEKGDYQDLAKLDKIVENIEDYVNVQKQIKDIEMDLRRAVDAYSQRKNYNTALRTFIQYDKYLTRMPADLQYKVKYQQGTILLWNLGNIANATNLSKGKMNEYIKNRKYRGMELLNDVQKNASDENLKRKAQIAMAKYKY